MPKDLFTHFNTMISSIHADIKVRTSGNAGAGYKKADICMLPLDAKYSSRSAESHVAGKEFHDRLAGCFGLEPKYLLRFMTQVYDAANGGSSHMDKTGFGSDRGLFAYSPDGGGAEVHFLLQMNKKANESDALLKYSFPAGFSVMRMGNCGLDTMAWGDDIENNLNTSHASHVRACCRCLLIVAALHFVALSSLGPAHTDLALSPLPAWGWG